MATGIVSIAAQLRGFHTIALTGKRRLLRRAVATHADSCCPVSNECGRSVGLRSVGFFTTVAATVYWKPIHRRETAPRCDWIMGRWYCFVGGKHVIFTILTVKAVKPSVEEGLRGRMARGRCRAARRRPSLFLFAPLSHQCLEAAFFFSLIHVALAEACSISGSFPPDFYCLHISAALSRC